MENQTFVDQLYKLALDPKDVELADAIIINFLRHQTSPKLNKISSMLESLSEENEKLKERVKELENEDKLWMIGAKRNVVEYLSEHPEKYRYLSEEKLRELVDNYVDENAVDIVNCVAEYQIHDNLDYSEWLDELIENKPDLEEEE
jgi:hypothetical protein